MVLELRGPPSQSLSCFPQHAGTRSVTTPPLDEMLVHPKVTPQHFIRLLWQLTSTFLYSWLERERERGTMIIKCFIQGYNTLTQTGLQHRSLTLEYSILTTWLLYFPLFKHLSNQILICFISPSVYRCLISHLTWVSSGTSSLRCLNILGFSFCGCFNWMPFSTAFLWPSN